MERRLLGVDISLGGIVQVLFELEAATNFAGRISTFELSMSQLYICS